ncbi:MAG: hypothetical protein Q3997_08815 [Propionibacteriaceae bacterium]|nr:hypothetical protein [Propionibacteriaceae bacterium]
MAETRKYQVSATGIAAAVRAAIGDDVRPVTPGAEAPQPAAEAPSAASPTMVSVPFLSAGAVAFLRPAEPDEDDPEW